jgi:hypothetical protein
VPAGGPTPSERVISDGGIAAVAMDEMAGASLEVASHGFTLTAAANVAFLELAWTPAKHDQAEDRLHRIGHPRAVTAWYLLAAETIDERIATLLEDKRHVVDSLTDGGEDFSTTLILQHDTHQQPDLGLRHRPIGQPHPSVDTRAPPPTSSRITPTLSEMDVPRSDRRTSPPNSPGAPTNRRPQPSSPTHPAAELTQSPSAGSPVVVLPSTAPDGSATVRPTAECRRLARSPNHYGASSTLNG